jgi:hypothetical protein
LEDCYGSHDDKKELCEGLGKFTDDDPGRRFGPSMIQRKKSPLGHIATQPSRRGKIIDRNPSQPDSKEVPKRERPVRTGKTISPPMSAKQICHPFE